MLQGEVVTMFTMVGRKTTLLGPLTVMVADVELVPEPLLTESWTPYWPVALACIVSVEVVPLEVCVGQIATFGEG